MVLILNNDLHPTTYFHFSRMQSFFIDQLTNAVKVLGLSDETKIDFQKVKRNFNRSVKSVHPDKNAGTDSGFSSTLEAYKLLDYYFNVLLKGKNCNLCNSSGPPEGESADSTHAFANHKLTNFCNIHSKESLNPGRFYSKLSKGKLELFEGTPYVQCRCGQVILVTPEVTALGITTFDCDLCSCSYHVEDS